MSSNSRTATVRADFNKKLGPLEIDRIALGQGGQSSDDVLGRRIAEIRALHPRILRYWVHEYFDLMPDRGVFQFEEAGRHLEGIVKTGAIPLVSINFKPKVLFPEINERIIDPTDYALWEDLVYRFVKYFVDRGHSGWYWEVIGESDCGEGGGEPYLATPENYPRFYTHTAQAILRADPSARAGGPGLGSCRHPILPALLAHCDQQNVPLHFITWHTYTSQPTEIRQTIEYVQELLAKYPSLKPETILDEWNLSLSPGGEALDVRFQPCFILETAWQMKDAGLDYSCYYQISDNHVDINEFGRFFSPGGAAFMARWWNRMPQWDGLFDYQNTVRPSYFAFKLLARLLGEKLELTSDDPLVHGFLTYDPVFQLYNLLVWNFSPEPAALKIELAGLSKSLVGLPYVLDAETPSNDENHRVRPLPEIKVENSSTLEIACEAYGVRFWHFAEHNWSHIPQYES